IWRNGLAPFLFSVSGEWSEPYVVTPGGTTMPRGAPRDYYDFDEARTSYKRFSAPDWILRLKLDPKKYRDTADPPEPIRRQLERFRLFSVRTRQYLRRRAWRYFRLLGKTRPDRYIAAICEALALYEDADVNSGLALLDNWGLVHALFHRSPVLVARRPGW